MSEKAAELLDTGKPLVFISYAHDNETHRERVLGLADRLNYEGVDCWIDRYAEGSSPEKGWPFWMEEKVRLSDYVLVVASERYQARYEGRETDGKGLGGKFESILIVNSIYQNDTVNTKFIPILFDEKDTTFIITPLQPATRYNVVNDESFESLYRRITNQIKIKKPPVGQIRVFADSVKQTFTTPIANSLSTIDDAGESIKIPEIPQIIDQMKPGLKVVQAFFGLGVHARFRLASELGLVEYSESPDNPDVDVLSTKFLLRAKEKNLMHDLWELLFDTSIDPNPFN